MIETGVAGTALVSTIIKALVHQTEYAKVVEVSGECVTIIEVRVHPDDLGRVIGRQGCVAKAIRTILNAVGMKERHRYVVEILGP